MIPSNLVTGARLSDQRGLLLQQSRKEKHWKKLREQNVSPHPPPPPLSTSAAPSPSPRPLLRGCADAAPAAISYQLRRERVPGGGFRAYRPEEASDDGGGKEGGKRGEAVRDATFQTF
jgi:hypothetical protein